MDSVTEYGKWCRDTVLDLIIGGYPNDITVDWVRDRERGTGYVIVKGESVTKGRGYCQLVCCDVMWGWIR